MTYPTQSLAKVLDEIDRDMIAVRQIAVRVHDKSIAGPITSTDIFDVTINLRNLSGRIVARGGTPGLVEYAQQQKGSESLDVATEAQTVIAAIDSVVAWVASNFPIANQGGVDYLLAQTLTQDGPVDRQFSTASLATFRDQITALISTIGA